MPNNRPQLPSQLIQANLHRQPATLSILQNLLFSGPFIALIQEPPTTRGDVPFNLPLPIKCLFHYTGTRTRACIYFRSDLCNLNVLRDFSSSDFVTACDSDNLFMISSIYRHETMNVSIFERLFCSSNNFNFCLFGGDFNAHHPSWDCWCSDDAVGHELCDLLDQFEYQLFNDRDQGPTFQNSVGLCSAIDLTFGSLGRCRVTWSLSDAIPSDHRTIFITCEHFDSVVSQTTKFKLTPALSARWSHSLRPLFSTNVVNSLVSTDDLDRWAEQLEDTSRHFVSVFRYAVRRVPKLVISPDLYEALDKWRRALRRFRSLSLDAQRQPGAFSQVQRSLAVFRRIERRARRTNFQRFIQNNFNKNPFGTAYRFIFQRGRKYPDFNCLRTEDDRTIFGRPAVTANLLAHFFPPGEPPNFYLPQIQQPLDPPITKTEIFSRVSRIKKTSAPGLDLMTTPMMRHLWADYSDQLTSVFNRCLSLGHFPKPWKCAKACFIPKGAQPATPVASNFRPLSLLPIIARIFDGVMTTRLRYYFHVSRAISDRQFGFVPGRGCDNAFLHFSNNLDRFLDRQFHIVTLSLDIKGAFDSADWTIISSILSTLNIPSNLHRLTLSFLTNRFIVADSQPARQLSQGCPQGSIAGPDLWNLLFDSFFRIFEQTVSPNFFVFPQAYADDAIVMIASKNFEQLSTYCQRVLSVLETWATHNRLRFSPSKTVFTIFTKNTRIIHKIRSDNFVADKFPLKLYGDPITYATTFKFLGVIIDDCLTWQPHIRHVTDKTHNLFARVLRVTRIRWGLNPQTLSTLYKAIFVPCLTYGCLLWGNRVAKVKTTALLLRRIQRRLLLKLTGCYRTCSYDKLFILSGLPPLDIYARALGESIRERLTGRNIERFPGVTACGHPGLWRRISYQLHREKFSPASINYFTDGSKSSDTGHCGAGYVALDARERVIVAAGLRLSPVCSVFQAEMFAILSALKHAANQASQRFTVSSDSLSSLLALGRAVPSTLLHNEVKLELAKLHDSGSTVDFFWVKGHAGVIGNELADRQAASARGPMRYTRIPVHHLRNALHRRISALWRGQPAVPGDGLLGVVFPNLERRLNAGKSFPIKYFYINQFLTGHGPFKSRIFSLQDKTCRCNMREIHDWRHVLERCPLADAPRSRLTRMIGSVSDMGNYIWLHYKKQSVMSRINIQLRQFVELSFPTMKTILKRTDLRPP
jgi:ribonuclease HI